MPNRSSQIQEQKQEQRQSLSFQQVQFVRLLELPIEGLEERVRAEVLENPALELKSEVDAASAPTADCYEEDVDDENVTGEEVAEGTYSNDVGEEELAALGDYRTEDDIPDYALRDYPSMESGVAEEIPFSVATSFYELLQEQLGEQHLTPQQREIAEYLIGSLDDDGLLRKELAGIVDELNIYQGADVTKEEVEEVLQVIQSFDPAGIGARDLCECLMLQLRRKPDSQVKEDAMQILEKCYSDFTYKRWDRIMQHLKLDEGAFESAIHELTHLNPRPGSSLSESVGKGMQQIVPDFIVQVDAEENITFYLNDGNVPDLRLSESFNQLIEEYSRTEGSSRESREALLFLRQKMDAAQSFIDIIEQRKRTLQLTMQTIIALQRPFFLEGDERLLRPMLMKDVAELAGVDVSTVSRVSNCKYVETSFGIYPLKFFFGDSYRKPNVGRKEKDTHSAVSPKGMDNGEEKSIREIRAIIQECVDSEEKQRPLNDEQLVEELKKRGFDVARRTVAKYRQQMGIPVARMRRG
ncbi:MAG: RNA polymerase factor sigma-54 [Bacteroidaceae bacterium]|nr:RNA polymerase factor sigma-54 [Bacteroidaceae bacterium]